MLMQILLPILGVILFIGLILIHEWGHFIAARKNGVEVEEFGLGIPPRAKAKRLKSGLLLSLNWIPLGGFVKLKGEHDGDTRPGTFGAASLGAKTKIMLAGVTMNLLAGLAILTILSFIGMPSVIDDQFRVKSDSKLVSRQVYTSYIEPGSPADKGGLTVRDRIESVTAPFQTVAIDSSEQLRTATANLAGQTVQLKINQKGKQMIKTVTLRSAEEIEASKKAGTPRGYLGVGTSELESYRATWSAPIVALGFTKQLVALTLQGLGHSLQGLGSLLAGQVSGNNVARNNGQVQATDQLVGPVGVGVILWGSGSMGLNFLLMIVAIISLTLALMNLLPLPALDGGRLFLTLVARGILKRPLSKKTEEKIIGVSMAVILGLGILITIVDVNRFF